MRRSPPNAFAHAECLVLTLDVDWASDDVIDLAAAPLIQHGVRATWFVTHSSAAIDRLRLRPDLFEIGIHPNFLPGSSHGDSPTQVLNTLRRLVPDAVSVRTHGLVQSTRILREMAIDFGIRYDCSLLLQGATGVEPHRLYLGDSLSLIRAPYVWEDDVENYRPRPAFRIEDGLFVGGGLQIFDFHPIHIALNTRDVSVYEKLKREMDLREASMGEIVAHANVTQPGTRDLYVEVIDRLSREPTRGMTVSELCDAWVVRAEG